jgi:hypothetical protein
MAALNDKERNINRAYSTSYIGLFLFFVFLIAVKILFDASSSTLLLFVACCALYYLNDISCRIFEIAARLRNGE